MCKMLCLYVHEKIQCDIIALDLYKKPLGEKVFDV